ncbi:MAG: Trp biosynthesis-associated membrane protein [Bowdeniella nasicola]|nr:Trp biosynthesis-associated membrane protein [Bowdeniella nasicola]
MTSTLTRKRAALALLAAGVAVLVCAISGWLRADVTSVAGTTTAVISGASIAPLATASSIVMTISAFALGFSHRIGSRLICLLHALAAGGAAWTIGSHIAMTPAAMTREFTDITAGTGQIAAVTTLPSLWVGTVVAIGAALFALYCALTCHRWPQTRARYDASTHLIPTDSRMRAIDDWDALGRGEDPTAKPGKLPTRRTP